jgi:alkanesulfonate monooxygenase SsuD/methylene tetrahydromethanopterin reductase-like flavin-dependent oxidoreductase (luciferase family)
MAKLGLYINPAADTPALSIVEQARVGERQGFDSVWLGDHLIDYRGEPYVPEGPPDSFTLMTAIGAVTSRIRLGWGTLNPSFRNPALLAKMVATLDQLTRGRVICSLGAGWLQAEYDAYGIPFIADHDERIAQEREVAMLLKLLWTTPAPEPVTFEGDFVRVRDLAFNPAPYQKPHPPILIGGDSELTLSLAKELGDGWVSLTRGQLDVVRELRAAPDWPSRPMTVARLSHVLVADTRDAVIPDAKRAHATIAGTYLDPPGGFEEFLAREPIGTPDECLEKLAAYDAAGIDTHLATFETDEQQARVGQLLLPLLGS